MLGLPVVGIDDCEELVLFTVGFPDGMMVGVGVTGLSSKLGVIFIGDKVGGSDMTSSALVLRCIDDRVGEVIISVCDSGD
mmetsp:Transcript_11085/g.24048  ORF Transcript_11085/g.24048 Transcript_11085/m.24048 type:complete len:80 (-) Transcript_11085:70-309(-)